jgi:hypothetical protein
MGVRWPKVWFLLTILENLLKLHYTNECTEALSYFNSVSLASGRCLSIVARL